MNGIYQLCIQNAVPYKGNEARGREKLLKSFFRAIFCLGVVGERVANKFDINYSHSRINGNKNCLLHIVISKDRC